MLFQSTKQFKYLGKLVSVFYHKSSEKQIEPGVLNNLFQTLPLFVQEKALKYRKWQDRQRCVIGKNLLLTGLKSYNKDFDSLNNLKYTKFGRPYIDSTIDFNLSHANDFTICAISETNRVGIDIEKVQRIDISDFVSQFSRSELRQIAQAKNSDHAFYKLWTQKESLVKAIGTGLSTPLHKIMVEDNNVTLDGQEWSLQEIELHNEYRCHLCTSTSLPLIAVHEVRFPVGSQYCC
jgi:4'-phosphopantetheinyl transferase